MEKINFKDLPNTDTPINSSNLNRLQTNVENAITHEYCQAKLGTSQKIDFDTLYANQRINFDTVVSKQGNLTLENSAIKIGKGISKVKVTYTVNVSDLTSEGLFSIQSGLMLNLVPMIRYYSFTGSYIREVTEGEEISVTLAMQSGTTNSITLLKSGNYISNTLLVEKIA